MKKIISTSLLIISTLALAVPDPYQYKELVVREVCDSKMAGWLNRNRCETVFDAFVLISRQIT